MPQPQAGIIPEPSPNALFLILRVREPATNGSAVAKVAAGVPSLVNKLGATDPRVKFVCTVSFGSEFWQVISPGKRPAGFRPFKAIEANGRSAPNTGGGVLFYKTLATFEKMLSRMMGTTGDGLHDHLMDYTRAVSGATFFAPSLEVLKSLRSR